MGRPINPEVTKLRRAIVEAWNKGASYADIMAQLDQPYDYVRQALHKARQLGWRVRVHDYRNPETTKLRRRVVRMFNAGHTQAEIGQALNLTRGAVGRLLVEARAEGIAMVSYTPSETSARQQAALRMNMIERATASLD